MSNLSMRFLCADLAKLRIFNPISIIVRNRTFRVQPRKRYPWWYMRVYQEKHNDYITPENKDFINEFKHDRYGQPTIVHGVPSYENASPLSSLNSLQSAKWTHRSKRTGLIARKIGVYPFWSTTGERIITTLLQVVDNHVIKYTPPEEHVVLGRSKPIRKKLGCLLVGAESADPTNITAAYAGLFKNSGVIPKKILVRFLITPDAVLPTGTPLVASHFRVGDHIDVRGKTVDRGFQGVMKRWGFHGMPATHGSTKTHRRPGNIGGGGEKARVWPGTKLPGHMGNRWRVSKGREILRINTKYNVIWVKGDGIPGETNSYCYLYDTLYYSLKPKTPPPFPTYIAEEVEEEDIFLESVHKFDAPSITFQE